MSMKRWGRALAKWAYGLVGGCVGAGVHSLSVKFGLDGLHEVGAPVPQVSMRLMGWIFLSGVITHAIMYIKQTPLPPLDFDETQQFFKTAADAAAKAPATPETTTETPKQ